MRSSAKWWSAAATLALLATTSPIQAQVSGSWNVDANGTYSSAANWLGGNVPGSGGVATFGDAFGLSLSRTVTVDVSPTLSGLSFDTNFIYTISGAAINLDPGSVFLLDVQRSNGLTPTLFGVGHIISAPIAGSATSFNKVGPGIVTLAATNSFTAPINILNGEVRLTTGDAALGNAANSLTLDGGSWLRVSTTALTSNRSVTIGSSGGMILPFVAVTLNGTLNGTGTLRIGGSTGGFTLGGDGSGFTGAVINETGTFTLQSSGVLGGTAGLDIAGTLAINNSATNNNNRIHDARTLLLRGAHLNFTGNAFGTTEAMGTLQLASGGSTVTLTSTTTGSTLQFSGLQRDNRSTVYFRGTNLGTGTPPASQIEFASSPGTLIGGGGPLSGTQISILPFAHGSTSATATTGTHFVTWDSGTNRLFVLGATNYTTLGLATANDNVDTGSATVNFGGQTINALRITGTLSGGATDVLTINSGAILTSGTTTINAPIAFASGREGILHATSALTINGIISGNNGMTKGGSGTLTLNGANTYTGVTTLLGGQITLTGDVIGGSPGPFGQDTSAIVMSSNSIAPGNSTTLRIWASGARVIDRDITVLGGGPAVVGLGSVGGAGNSLTINGNITVNNPNGTLNSAFLTFEGDPTFTEAVTVNGTISGSGGIRDAFSSFVILNGNNDFSGGINVATGSYFAGHNNAFGTGTVWFSGLGFIGAIGGPRTIANNLHAQSDFTFTGTEALTVTGGLFLAGGGPRIVTVNTTGDGVAISGTVAGGSLLKAGPGTLTLSGTNEYSGSTLVRNGTLTLGGDALVGSGTLGTNPNTTVGTSGTVQLGDASTLAANNLALLVNGAYTVARNVTVNNQNSTGTSTVGGSNTSGTATYSGQLTLNRTANATQLSAAAGGTVAFSGLITESAAGSAVSITGGGTVIFSNPTGNTYTGVTTVNAGATLLAMNTSGSATGTNTVNVNAGGTLGGTGQITGAVNVAGGSVSPGSSPGILTLNSLVADSATNFVFELGGHTPGNGAGFYDQLVVLNNFNISGALTVNTFGGFNPEILGGAFFIVARGSGTGTFNGLNEGDTVSIDGGTYFATITYLANWTGDQNTSTLTGGNDVALLVTAIPEPGTMLLFGAGLAGSLGAYRLRRYLQRR